MRGPKISRRDLHDWITLGATVVSLGLSTASFVIALTGKSETDHQIAKALMSIDTLAKNSKAVSDQMAEQLPELHGQTIALSKQADASQASNRRADAALAPELWLGTPNFQFVADSDVPGISVEIPLGNRGGSPAKNVRWDIQIAGLAEPSNEPWKLHKSPRLGGPGATVYPGAPPISAHGPTIPIPDLPQGAFLYVFADVRSAATPSISLCWHVANVRVPRAPAGTIGPRMLVKPCPGLRQ